MACSAPARAAGVELRAHARAGSQASPRCRGAFSGLTAAVPPVRVWRPGRCASPPPGKDEEEADVARRIALAAAALIGFALGLVYAAGRGAFGAHEGPGEIAGRARPIADLEARVRGDREAGRALGVAHPKQVLFGDLHVHTTFSFDAFMFSLPLLGGEGAHPPADACDFARYCSALD
ncbi:MAG: DUF3604 domain-containing protein, partial [Deltaproteobacteria bacterium]